MIRLAGEQGVSVSISVKGLASSPASRLLQGYRVQRLKQADIDPLDILQLPHIVSRYFIGMTALERSDRLLDNLVSHNELDLPFLNLLDLASSPDEWLTAVQRAELTLAEHLP
jgi:hypothetical protein